jgi:polysaccharide biosynthesis protein VpsM
MTASAQFEDDSVGRVRASLTTALFYTDNFFYQPEETQSAIGAWLRPELAYKAEARKLQLDARVSGEYGTFDTPGSKDNYLDGLGALTVGWIATQRSRFTLDGALQRGHDPFGLDRTEGTATTEIDLDEWNQTTGGLRYRFGTPGARVNAEVGVSSLAKEYQTNRDATQFLDYDSTAVNYALYYNYTPKTAAVLSFSRTDIQFDRPFDNTLGPGGSALDNRSGEVYQVRVGATWLATAKTSGDVRAGYRERTFDQLDVSEEGFDWQAGIKWSPTAPMLIELKSGRSEQQSYLSDTNVIDTDFTSLSIRRSLRARTRGTVMLEQSNADFVGGERSDHTNRAVVGLEHVLKTNLFLVGNIGYETRSSSDSLREYDRMSGFVGVRLGHPG